MIKLLKVLLFCFLPFFVACQSSSNKVIINDTSTKQKISEKKSVITGAERIDQYISLLKNKNVAIVANQTSVIKNKHLVDTLSELKINIKKIFAPEHGFRGKSEAGAHISSNIDKKTGIPVVSLYGKNYKPSQEQLNNIDIIIFDIQDVGARFYTYISTLHYVMEACAEKNIDILILDRPNPNGFYVDGPILDLKYKSFVGMHPVPIVHGMTMAEYGLMINGEKWLKDSLTCKLSYIECDNYDHNTLYQLPIPPSPNLPDMTSIYLYPSLCLFEGTIISVGRGTNTPFSIIGHPEIKKEFNFTPISIEGKSKYPKHQDKICYGYDLRNYSDSIIAKKELSLKWLILMYKEKYSNKFFNNFFKKLSGNNNIQKGIIENKSEIEIKSEWKKDLDKYKSTRRKYLLYKDFN